MADLTDTQKKALETYGTGSGWYQYPGMDIKVREDKLLELLDGDEFETADETPKPKKAKTKNAKAKADNELVHGDKNHGVLALRALLNLVGYPTSMNAAFDGELERSVIEFQRSAGIPSTGTCTPETWNELLNFDRPI